MIAGSPPIGYDIGERMDGVILSGSAEHILICEAVKDKINGTVYSQAATAIVRLLPIYKLSDMGVLHVTIVPSNIDTAAITRGHNQSDYDVDIAIQKRLDDTIETGGKALMLLVQEIDESFRRKQLTEYPAVWTASRYKTIYDPEHLETMRQFTCILTLTFRRIA